MPARRGEVPFVATSLARLDDPRETLDLADELKIPIPHAIGILVLLDALTLKHGDARTGKVRDFGARHIARELHWTGKPAKLIAALRKLKIASLQRSVLTLKNWLTSPTGIYAAKKAEDRDEWARQKAVQRAAARAAALGPPVSDQSVHPDVHPMSTWTPGGRPPTVHLDGGQKERKESSGHTPPAPAQSAGELASRRWAELLQTGNANDIEGCKREALKISEDEWPCALWVSAGCPGRPPRSSSRKLRVPRSGAYQILRSGEWRRFLGEYQEKLRLEAAPKNGKPTAPPVDAETEAKAHMLRNLLECMADPTASEKSKALRRAAYEARFGPVPAEVLQSEAPAN